MSYLKHTYVTYLFIILAWLSADQISKFIAQESLMKWENPESTTEYLGSKKELLELGDRLAMNGFFFYVGFNYVRNPGSAWGMFAAMPPHIRMPFFHGITIVALIVLIVYFRLTEAGQTLVRLGIISIFAGAAGNYIDRFRLRYVIDFIDLRWRIGNWEYSFPNFNIADIAITFGFIAIGSDLFMKPPSTKLP